MRVNVESCSYTIWLQMFLLPGEPRSRYVNPSSEEQAVCLSVPCADNRLRVMAVLTADGGPADAHPDSFDAGYEVYGNVEACIAGEKGHSAVVYCDKLQRSQSSNLQSLNDWSPASMYVQGTYYISLTDCMQILWNGILFVQKWASILRRIQRCTFSLLLTFRWVTSERDTWWNCGILLPKRQEGQQLISMVIMVTPYFT